MKNLNRDPIEKHFSTKILGSRISWKVLKIVLPLHVTKTEACVLLKVIECTKYFRLIPKHLGIQFTKSTLVYEDSIAVT